MHPVISVPCPILYRSVQLFSFSQDYLKLELNFFKSYSPHVLHLKQRKRLVIHVHTAASLNLINLLFIYERYSTDICSK
jgi:hypothetical protein